MQAVAERRKTHLVSETPVAVIVVVVVAVRLMGGGRGRRPPFPRRCFPASLWKPSAASAGLSGDLNTVAIRSLLPFLRAHRRREGDAKATQEGGGNARSPLEEVRWAKFLPCPAAHTCGRPALLPLPPRSHARVCFSPPRRKNEVGTAGALPLSFSPFFPFLLILACACITWSPLPASQSCRRWKQMRTMCPTTTDAGFLSALFLHSLP